MSQPTQPPPHLTPSLCFSTSALRTFLRTSRTLIDDPISTHLNSLLTPSTTPFSPTTLTTIRTGPTPHTLPPNTCTPFIHAILFPSWRARSTLLQYCASVALSPDPDDPDAVAREAYNRRETERVVDERLDPYSGRFFPREARTEELARVLGLEEGVERIVRERTWGVVRARCEGLGGSVGGTLDEGYDREFAAWCREQERREDGGEGVKRWVGDKGR